MVSVTAVSAVIIITFGAMIEPTLAGPAVGVARAGLTAASVISSSSSKQGHKRDITEAQIDFLFHPCFKRSAENPPTMNYNTATNSGDITNLPKECMQAFEVYNDEINSEKLGHAKVKITGPTSVHVDSIPPQFLKELETEFGKPIIAAPTPNPTAERVPAVARSLGLRSVEERGVENLYHAAKEGIKNAWNGNSGGSSGAMPIQAGLGLEQPAIGF